MTGSIPRKQNVRRLLLPSLHVTVTLALGLTACNPKGKDSVQLFVASSLVDVAGDIAERFEANHPGTVVQVHHAGSGMLRQQILAGAPCDIFISADRSVSRTLRADQEVDYSEIVATNQLVVFTRRDGPQVNVLQDLSNIPTQQVVLGNPRLAPVGRYAEQALVNAGFTPKSLRKFLHAESARHVVAMVAAGGAEVGVGFATDVMTEPRVITRLRIPSAWHEPIEYEALLLLRRRNHKHAKQLLQAFSSPDNQDLWKHAGFGTDGVANGRTAKPRASLEPLWRSLQVATWATLLAGLLGLAVARVLQHRQSRRSNVMSALLDLPLVLPPTVIGLLLLMLLGPQGPLGAWFLEHLSLQIAFTLVAAVLAAAIMALPLMVRSARAALEAVPRRYAQAAEVAGASRWRIFWSIEMPLAKRGILAGLLLTFFRALGEFGATLLVAGNIPGSTQTLPLAIYSASFEGHPANALPLILCIALLAFAGAWGAQTLSRSARS